MSIQEFHSQLACNREKAPLLLALRRLSRLSDLKGLANTVTTTGGWTGEWPAVLASYPSVAVA